MSTINPAFLNSTLPSPQSLQLHYIQNPLPTDPYPPTKTPIYILEFWATWCGPCRDSIPHLNQLHQKHSKTKDIHIIGITNEKDESKIKAFVKEKGMEYSIAMDVSNLAQREVFQKSGSRGIPFAVILDASNRVRFAGHPLDPQFVQTLESLAPVASLKEPLKEPEALQPIKESFEELMKGRSVKELKTILADRGIDFKDCLEKADLAKRVVEREYT
jgi:thiol-disulfide isomerase/thioredoxin